MLSRSPSRYVVSSRDPISKKAFLELASGLPGYTEDRYEKYHRRNPIGETLLAVLREAESGDPVGMAALFRVRARVNGEPVNGAIAGDFVIVPRHRSLGPALSLQRYLLSALPEAKLEFVLSAPNELAEPVFLRMGYALLHPQVHFVRILRSREILASRLPGAIARPLSRLADPLLITGSRLLDRGGRKRYAIVRPERFDERFDGIWQAAEARTKVLVERNAELLNWKYEQDLPAESKRFGIFALSNGDSVVAYLVHERRDDVVRVHEALGLDGALGPLIGEFVAAVHADASLVILSCYCSGNELARALLRHGFIRRRPARKLLLHVVPESVHAATLLDADNWFFVQGDLDL